MTKTLRRLTAATCVSGAMVLATGGAASAQTITVEFGPIEVLREGNQITVEFGPGEIIQEGIRTTYMEGDELVIVLPPPEVLEGSELILFIPRQSITFEADGGTGGGGGGGGGGPDVPPCPPDTGCGG